MLRSSGTLHFIYLFQKCPQGVSSTPNKAHEAAVQDGSLGPIGQQSSQATESKYVLPKSSAYVPGVGTYNLGQKGVATTSTVDIPTVDVSQVVASPAMAIYPPLPPSVVGGSLPICKTTSGITTTPVVSAVQAITQSLLNPIRPAGIRKPNVCPDVRRPQFSSVNKSDPPVLLPKITQTQSQLGMPVVANSASAMNLFLPNVPLIPTLPGSFMQFVPVIRPTASAGGISAMEKPTNATVTSASPGVNLLSVLGQQKAPEIPGGSLLPLSCLLPGSTITGPVAPSNQQRSNQQELQTPRSGVLTLMTQATAPQIPPLEKLSRRNDQPAAVPMGTSVKPLQAKPTQSLAHILPAPVRLAGGGGASTIQASNYQPVLVQTGLVQLAQAAVPCAMPSSSTIPLPSVPSLQLLSTIPPQTSSASIMSIQSVPSTPKPMVSISQQLTLTTTAVTAPHHQTALNTKSSSSVEYLRQLLPVLPDMTTKSEAHAKVTKV